MQAKKEVTNSYSGRVRWFNRTFGYGFIKHSTGEDVFFHYTDIVVPNRTSGRRTIVVSKKTGKMREYIPGRDPRPGETVSYDYRQVAKGLRVKWVKRGS